MTASVPKLDPLPLGRGVRMLSRVAPGVRAVTRQIQPYTRWWNDQNQMAARGDGPLLVVVGDSTAIGIGASAPERGYVGRLRDHMRRQHHEGWRVVNLALSGARVSDAIDRQIPIIERLQPDLVICCVGTNDVVWERQTGLRARLHQLAGGLPSGSHFSTLAGSSDRARAANRAIHHAARSHGLHLVNPWEEPGPPPRERLARDWFHPNDTGHELMARAFSRNLTAAVPGPGFGNNGSEGSVPERGAGPN
ncbi:MAG: SGNH/GDSL hydrolase family protein [Actinomycetia bacterium]|nr:SGNH/GDSL hydrolase family protein [Actinomycetes bacterium]MCP4226265.1 SGNH/GDSL hydrolase family protein [Actinomycetes bacterium]MCP5032132.1 SGNH/GDSL hydrolase family protein [Actinomycetes bacterium]